MKNIIFDINGNLKNKDIYRQQEMINYLNCKFIRYNSFSKKIEEY